jgi:hypothetical protein
VASQLEIQEKFNEVLLQTNKLLIAQSKIVATQAEMLANMVLSIKEMDFTKLQKQAANLKDITSNLERGLGDVKKTSKDAFGELTEGIDKVTKKGNSFNEVLENIKEKEFKIAQVGAQAFVGFGQGLKLSANLTRNLLGFSKELIKSLVHLGISIVTLPFKMLKGLIEMSSQGGDNSLAIQLEEIRKEFGYLRKESGAAIISMSRSMRGQLANTGLSVYRVFGRLVDKLKYFAEYAKALGPIFDTMMNHIGEGGAEALGAYNKALGFTNEGLKAIASRAMSSGRDINSINQEIANYALQMSDAFGVSMKLVSRDVGEMMNDFQHFGQLGVKQLTQVSIYAHKLGIEVKSLGAIMDKWMNFEDAAQGAAQLSQAFGLNIDALEMMKAQDPAQKIEQMRKAFFRAGKSVETMTYQERRLLAQQTGLDDASIGLAFSLKNQGISYDQIQKKGNAAQKAQLTQAQAMEKLSGAIERMIQSGSGINEGFIDTFFRGFRIGIVRTRDFRKIMRELQRDLRATLYAGMQVGRMFVKMFPGVQDFFGGMRDFFEPRKFRQMLGKIKEAFHTFFEQIAGHNPRALPNLLKNLKAGFLSWFDARTANGQRFLNGAKQMFTAFVEIVNGLLTQAIAGLTEGIDFITDLITGRRNLSSLLGRMGSAGGFIGEMFQKMLHGIPALVDDLGNAIIRLWKAFKDKYGDRVLNYYFASMLAVSLGTAFARGFLTAAAGGLASGIGALARRFAERASPAMATAGRTVGANVPNLPSGTGSAAADTLNGTGEAARAAQRNRSSLNPSVIPVMVVAGLIIVGGILVLMEAVKKAVIWIRENNVSIEEITKAGIIMAASTAMMVGASASTALLMAAAKFSAGSLGGLVVGIVAMAGVMYVTIESATGMVEELKKMHATKEDIIKAAIMMGAISGFMLAASAVVGVIGVVGAIVTATGGGALAVLGVGLATLAVVIQGMVSGTMEIMRQIDNFNPTSKDFIPKTQLFLNVIRGLGTFAGIFGNIVRAAIPGFFSANSAAGLQETLSITQGIIKEIGDQALGIMRYVVQQTNQMSPEQLTRATMFVDMLRGIGDFVKNLIPPTQVISDSSAWFEGNNSVEKIAMSANYTTQLVHNIKDMMLSTFQILQRMQPLTFNENSLNGVKSFAEIMKAMGTLIPSLVPNREVMQFVIQIRDARGFNKIAEFMQNVMSGFVASGVFHSLGAVITDITNAMKGLNESQARSLTTIAPVITAAFQAIGSIASVVSTIMPLLRGGTIMTALGNGPTIANVTEMLDTLFTQIRDFLPRMISSVLAIRISRQQSTEITAKANALKSIFDAISTIPNAIQGFGRVGPGGDADGIERIVRSASTIIDMLFGTNREGNTTASGFQMALFSMEQFFVPSGLKQKAESIKSIFDALNSITSAANNVPQGQGIYQQIEHLIEPLKYLFDASTYSTAKELQLGMSYMANFQIPRGLEAKARAVSSVFTALHTATDNASNISEMATHAQAMMEAINSGAISKIGNSISKMVEEVNTISDTMHNMDVPNINIALRRISRDIGLGESGTFTVHKGNTNVNVHLTVTMDSRDLQTTLVETSQHTKTGPRLGISHPA